MTKSCRRDQRLWWTTGHLHARKTQWKISVHITVYFKIELNLKYLICMLIWHTSIWTSNKRAYVHVRTFDSRHVTYMYSRTYLWLTPAVWHAWHSRTRSWWRRRSCWRCSRRSRPTGGHGSCTPAGTDTAISPASQRCPVLQHDDRNALIEGHWMLQLKWIVTNICLLKNSVYALTNDVTESSSRVTCKNCLNSKVYSSTTWSI